VGFIFLSFFFLLLIFYLSLFLLLSFGFYFAKRKPMKDKIVKKERQIKENKKKGKT